MRGCVVIYQIGPFSYKGSRVCTIVYHIGRFSYKGCKGRATIYQVCPGPPYSVMIDAVVISFELVHLSSLGTVTVFLIVV